MAALPAALWEDYTVPGNDCMNAASAFASLNRMTGLAPLRAPSFSGADPILPTPFRAAEAAAAALGLAGSISAEIWRLRGGAQQEMSVDLAAAAASLVSFALLRLDGEAVPRPSETNPAVAFYRAGCGRWIHLHGGFPHLAQGTLSLLAAENTTESVADAVAKWKAFALEDALAHLGLCGAVARGEEEWRASPQGQALAETPPIVLMRMDDAPRLELEKGGDAPLSGIRVLDLTRVLAGPAAGRTLASHGADVLTVRAGRLPAIDVFDLDTGQGKRSADLDLAEPADAERLRRLCRRAHVFVESYRPGALARLGFTSAALAHLSPGIVHAVVSCYGHKGPWAARPGWEQLAQTATGIALEQGAFMAARAGKAREAARPRLVPAAACDYITGYLAAAGIAAALLRRMREGGSWRVEVSLCATAMWLQALGRLASATVPENWNPLAGLDGYMKSCNIARGRLDFLGPVLRMSETPPAWRRPPPEPGADEAAWLD